MNTCTRYAIQIDVSNTDLKIFPKVYWHCQGLPNDRTDFGYAILYATKEKAEHAMKTGRGPVQNYGKIVKVICSFEVDA